MILGEQQILEVEGCIRGVERSRQLILQPFFHSDFFFFSCFLKRKEYSRRMRIVVEVALFLVGLPRAEGEEQPTLN